MSFRAFSRNEAVFAEKCIETSKHGSFLEKLQVVTKSMSFRAFSRNEPLFPTFSLKFYQNAKTWRVGSKSWIVFAKSMISRAFSPNVALPPISSIW